MGKIIKILSNFSIVQFKQNYFWLFNAFKQSNVTSHGWFSAMKHIKSKALQLEVK